MIYATLSVISTLLINFVYSFNDTIPEQFFNVWLDRQNPSSFWPPKTDAGGQPPFKYPFSFSNRGIYQGGWSRQVTVRDFPISKQMAGAQMRLVQGGIRELHWHVQTEWAYMIYGHARITAVDDQGRAYVADVKAEDLWIFPGGYPHSIEGIGDDGAFFILVFDDGNFSEFNTFGVADWMNHVPREVLAKNFQVHETTFADIPKENTFIFKGQLPEPIQLELAYATNVTGPVPNPFAFFTNQMEPTAVRTGGMVKIVDGHNFPATTIAAAIVELKPGALRELHWHPNADEWQYYVKGKARMGVFAAGGEARTMDFEAGDVGYVEKSVPHYIENTGTEVLVFLEVFRSKFYSDVSLAQWLAHEPRLLVNQNIRTGYDFILNINKTKAFILP